MGTFQQAATMLNSIVKQATGETALAATDLSDYISVGKKALTIGYDPIFNAISQVIGRTIFSIRPYYAKLKGLEFSESRFGAITRKISVANGDAEDAAPWKWPVAYDAGQTSNPTGNGQSVDQWDIKKPDLFQTNFYGQDVYDDHWTLFKDQVDIAFHNPEEAMQLWGMISTEMSNRKERRYESIKRATLANLMGGIIDENQTDRVVHLISEYNAKCGYTTEADKLTATTIYQPANYKAFVQFAYARMAEIASALTDDTIKYQTLITGHPIPRHTPYQDMRVYTYAPERYSMEMMAIADIYHDSYLKMAETESVNFWQSADTKNTLKVTPVYTDATGAPKKGSALTKAGVFALISDREACGVAEIGPWQQATPLNAKGGYSNLWYHSRFRAFCDNTEKAVVFLLD